MSSSLSVIMSFHKRSSGLDLLQRFINTSDYRPCGLGISTVSDIGDSYSAKYFLGGWGLEEVLDSFTQSDWDKNIEIITPCTEDTKQIDYLDNLIDRIRSETTSTQELSMYESKNTHFGITFLNSPKLDKAILNDAKQFLCNTSRAMISLFGTFSIDVKESESLPWKHAFHSIYNRHSDGKPCYGNPIVNVVIVEGVQEECTCVFIQSWSRIWLRRSNALRGNVGPIQADENLNRFTRLVAHIAGNISDHMTPVEVKVSGSIFRDEIKRIKKAFSCYSLEESWTIS